MHHHDHGMSIIHNVILQKHIWVFHVNKRVSVSFHPDCSICQIKKSKQENLTFVIKTGSNLYLTLKHNINVVWPYMEPTCPCVSFISHFLHRMIVYQSCMFYLYWVNIRIVRYPVSYCLLIQVYDQFGIYFVKGGSVMVTKIACKVQSERINQPSGNHLRTMQDTNNPKSTTKLLQSYERRLIKQ